MAYVRSHGNQLAIVHGERDSETGQVRQRVLFKICSKPEANAAIEESSRLQHLLESRHRQIKFDWPKIRAAIGERADELPDEYPYREAEVLTDFRRDLASLTRQLLELDPLSMYSAADVLRANRVELEFLVDLIGRRLRTPEQEETRWNTDNEFFWLRRARVSDVPPDIMEFMAGLYERQELDRLEALAGLFVECFDDYADGYNYMGLVARDRGRFDEAIGHFEQAVASGRRLFPKRLAKKHYWVDIDTRPYIRALRNLAGALQLAERYDEALEVCDQLERECDDGDAANCFRAEIRLCMGDFADAREAANRIVRIWPEYSYVAAFASKALDEEEDAASWFLHGLITRPRTGAILLGLSQEAPASSEEVLDHNRGVEFLERLSEFADVIHDTQDFFLVRHAKSSPFVREKRRLDEEWRRSNSAARRREELMSLPFAFRVGPQTLQP